MREGILDNLKVIDRIIQEHHGIRANIKLVGDSLNDTEAFDALQQINQGWVPGRLDILTERKSKLQQTLAALTEGLIRHFSFEEQYLPALFGEFLFRALILEHQEIRNEIDLAKGLLHGVKLEGLSREDILTSEVRINQTISSMSHEVEEHASREEVILKMLQRALESRMQV